MRRTHSILAAITVVAMLASGCGADDRDNLVFPVDPSEAAEPLRSGDGWALERVDGVRPCVRLRVGDRSTSCLSEWSFSEESWSMMLARSQGRAFAYLLALPGQDIEVRWWSSTCAPCSVEPLVVDDLTVLLIELADGEEPWGMQVLGEDGALLKVWSAVGQ